MPNTSSQIEVLTGARLHFGLYRFGGHTCGNFGGLGTMIETPTIKISVTSSDRFLVTGPFAQRVLKFAQHATHFWNWNQPPACHLHIETKISPHSGLGTGTQLGLATLLALRTWLGLPKLAPQKIASVIKRGNRSAVGSHGFFHGGLLLDGGKQDADLGLLEKRVELPKAWRFLLIQPNQHENSPSTISPQGAAGFSGLAEEQAFKKLPPIPESTTTRLLQLAEKTIFPAAIKNDFNSFSEAIYQYGYLAGECFSSCQGGPYASQKITQTIQLLKSLGVEGVGQSSWGPTIFALLPDQKTAEQLLADLKKKHLFTENQMTLARPKNNGAKVKKNNIPPTESPLHPAAKH